VFNAGHWVFVEYVYLTADVLFQVFNCMTLFKRLSFILVVVSATKKLSSYFSELIDDMLVFNSQNLKNSVDDVISVVKINIHLFFIFMFMHSAWKVIVF